MNELEALMALSEIPLLGSVKIKLLIKYFGSAAKALEADSIDIAHVPGFGPKILATWNKHRRCQDWQKNWELAERLNVKVIPFSNEKYPKWLLGIADHPVLLYVKGDLNLADMQGMAVVGTRNPCCHGLEMADKFSCALAEKGITVVSGLARGIDTAAHRGALCKGRTIAVMGAGLATIYPRENDALAALIAEKGALISEFAMNAPIDKQNFPQRNRTITGMSRGILLIESPLKGGAMIAMEKGWSQGRALYALSSQVYNENFKGNRALIETGQAKAVERPSDILEDGLFNL